MSEDNVEIVRRANEAILRKPKPDFDTINELYHPDHELVSVREHLEGGVRMGALGYRDWLIEVDQTWEQWDSRVDQIRSINGDRVWVETAFSGLSKRGGVPVEQTIIMVVTVKEGQIARSEIFTSRAEALEAAGVKE